MKFLLAHARAHFPSEKKPVGTFAIALCLSMLFLWARHEVFWARYQPRVHVRWSESVVSSTRAALESQYQLRDPQYDSERTWSYVPADTSAATIRALVLDPAVEDTHKIDRQRFKLVDEVPLGPLEGSFWWLWTAALGVAAGVLAAWIGHDRWTRGFRLWRHAWAWVTRLGAVAYRTATPALTRGVPDLRADVLGFFRFFYATFLFLALANGRLTLEPGRIPDDGQLGWAWLGWLASRAPLVVSLEYALLGLLALFAIGLWTRLTYPLIAAGMALWVLVGIESQHSNAHEWIVTIFVILCLVPVPWDVEPSVDGAIRRWRGKAPTAIGGLHGKLYGYPVWVPGLILGTVWASAAFAKIDVSGPMWVFGGAVKYHWVLDARNAPVDWGLWIASHHWAAVFLAGCGVAFEAVFIVSAFLKPGGWRNVFVSTGLPLLIGFYLFHGLLWWTWWLAFLIFAAPWTLMLDAVASRSAGWLREAAPAGAQPVAGGSRDLRPVHVLLIVAVCLHAMVRLPAGFGRFESYSGTYGSTAEFDRISHLDPLDRLWVGYGSPSAVEVVAETAAEAIARLARGEPLWAHHAASLRALDRLAPLAGHSPGRVTLTRQQVSFDWANGRFNGPGPAVVIGTFDLESMTLVSEQGTAVVSGRPQSR